MKPCFGYIRVSTQKQGEGVSLEAQKDAITAFASRNDLTITIKWFEEKGNRRQERATDLLNEMLRQLKRGKATGLIMHKIDRSARNPRDWADISDLSDATASTSTSPTRTPRLRIPWRPTHRRHPGCHR